MSDVRELGAEFVRREVAPYLQDWEYAGTVPRELHLAAAKQGLLGVAFPEELGGGGGDLLDSVDLQEAMFEAGASSGLMAALFTGGIALPHIAASGNTDLIDRFVRPTLAGEKIGSLGVTEPGGGSDVAGIRTNATRDEDFFVVNGAKAFITSGVRADFVTTVVRTGGPGHASTGPEVGASFKGHVKRNGVGPTYWSPCQVTQCVENEVFEFEVGTDDVTMTNWGYRLEPDGSGTKVTEYYRLEPKLPLRIYWLLLGRLRGRTNEKGMRTTLERMRAVVEK